MLSNSTENDAEIARLLAEDEKWNHSRFSSSSSQSNPSKRIKTLEYTSLKRSTVDNVEQTQKDCSSNDVNTSRNNNTATNECSQSTDDADIALILQIEEIVLSENKINSKTVRVTEGQLEKTHADMTKALQETTETSLLSRIKGILLTIYNRYLAFQAKNQILIDQIKDLSMQLLPLLISFQTGGKAGISKETAPALAVGVVTNLLHGNLEFDGAKQILSNILEIWNESSVWYELLEQFVYLLVAVTVSVFTTGAMTKVFEKVFSLK